MTPISLARLAGRAKIASLALAIVFAGWSAAGGADDNPMLGTWSAEDPDSGERGNLTFMADSILFDDESEPVPYRFERAGDVVSVFIGGGDGPPATFTLIDDGNAELVVPGGPTVALTRVAAAAPAEPTTPRAETVPAETAPALPRAESMIDEFTAAMLPHGVPTRYEPLGRSLEQLLSDGWTLNQASGAQGGFTMLLTNGPTLALCILVPKQMGDSDTALSDCRRLN